MRAADLPRGQGPQRGARRPGLALPARDPDGDQPRALDRRVGIAPLHAAVLRRPEVAAKIAQRAHAEAVGGERDERRVAGRVVLVPLAEPRRDRALGQVIHALPCTPLDTDDRSDGQQPLERDLLRRPVPPHVLRPRRLAS